MDYKVSLSLYFCFKPFLLSFSPLDTDVPLQHTSSYQTKNFLLHYLSIFLSSSLCPLTILFIVFVCVLCVCGSSYLPLPHKVLFIVCVVLLYFILLASSLLRSPSTVISFNVFFLTHTLWQGTL